MIKCNCGTRFNVRSRWAQHTFSRRHFATQYFLQLRPFKGSISQKQVDFEKLLLLLLFSRVREEHKPGGCCFLLRNFTAFEDLTPSWVLAPPCWSGTSAPQQNTDPGHLHSMCLAPCFWQSEEDSPMYHVWGPEEQRVSGNTCSIIHMAKAYPEVSHDSRACLPLYIYFLKYSLAAAQR